MSKKVKTLKEKDTMDEIKETQCEECGSTNEEKKMSSLSTGKRQQVQDEYDMKEEDEEEDEEDEMEDEDEKDEDEDEEEEDEMEEGYSMKKETKSEMKEQDCEDDMEEEKEEKEEMDESFKSILKDKGLSEEFQLEVSTLFEAAVNSRVKKIEEQLANKFTNLLESEVEEIANDLTEKVDSYLDYVVSEWMEENKLAVERGIRTDIAESFISGLKNLFNEHNIAVPEGQTDLLDETANNLEKVTEQLNLQIKKTLSLTEELKKYQRAEIFAETTEGLSSVQVEKLRELAENMRFSDNAEFKAKLQILKENYGKSAPKAAVSSTQIEDTSEPANLNEETRSDVSAYLQAMLRRNK